MISILIIRNSTMLFCYSIGHSYSNRSNVKIQRFHLTPFGCRTLIKNLMRLSTQIGYLQFAKQVTQYYIKLVRTYNLPGIYTNHNTNLIKCIVNKKKSFLENITLGKLSTTYFSIVKLYMYK